MIKSLYGILKEDGYSIVIPRIQRDYAQGRKGEEDKRRDFLAEIKKYLQLGEKLKLDFVFGSNTINAKGEKQFVPIDGQQRITTLWLLHWFFAVKTNIIAQQDVCEWLHRFNYETRNSSSEFCEKLCVEFHKAASVNDKQVLLNKISQFSSLAEYIQNQTWFFTEYTHDPTVDAMLRTISGETEYICVLLDRASRIKNEIKRIYNYKNDVDLCSLYNLIGSNTWEYVDLDDVKGLPKTADLIQRQSWFDNKNNPVDFSKQSICNLLSRLDNEKYFGEDCLEGVFYECDYETLWNRLTRDSAIVFEKIDVGGKQLPVTDDLYIKMNSRGKHLSNFENFKSDFITWIRSNKYYNANRICLAIDKEWTDVILRTVLKNYEDLNKSDDFDGVLDDVFFVFINRFVFYKLYRICKRNKEAGSESFEEKEEVLFLLGKKNKDDLGTDLDIHYSSFDCYRNILTIGDANELNEIFLFLNKNQDFIGDLGSLYDKYQVKNISFIPHYRIDKDSKITLQHTTYKSRIYFQAVRAFIKASKNVNYDKSKLDHWVRISRNIIENTEISNVKQMVTCSNLVDWLAMQLIANKGDIYVALYKHKNKLGILKTPSQEDQVIEEIVKVITIRDQARLENSIINAENHAFFRGSIRFLYSDDRGNEDWSNFETKYINAKNKWFQVSTNASTNAGNNDNDDGDADVDINANEVREDTIINFLHCFKSFEDILISSAGVKRYVHMFTSIGYHHRKHCWKKDILLQKDLWPYVNKLLMSNTDIGFDNSVDSSYRDFIAGDGPQKLFRMNDNYKICLIEYGSNYAFHKDRLWYDYLLVGTERKNKCEILMNDQRIRIMNKEVFSEYLYGKEIQFIYNNQSYGWSVKEEEKNGKAKDYVYKTKDGKRIGNEIEWKDDLGFDLIAEIDKNLNP